MLELTCLAWLLKGLTPDNLMIEFAGGRLDDLYHRAVDKVRSQHNAHLERAIKDAFQKAVAAQTKPLLLTEDTTAERAFWWKLNNDSNTLFPIDDPNFFQDVTDAVLFGYPKTLPEALTEIAQPYAEEIPEPLRSTLLAQLPPAFLNAFQEVLSESDHAHAWNAFVRELLSEIHGLTVGTADNLNALTDQQREEFESIKQRLDEVFQQGVQLPDFAALFVQQAESFRQTLLPALTPLYEGQKRLEQGQQELITEIRYGVTDIKDTLKAQSSPLAISNPLNRYLDDMLTELQIDIEQRSPVPLHSENTPDAVTIAPLLFRFKDISPIYPGGPRATVPTSVTRNLHVFDTFAEALEAHNQHVLLLGEPGAGKSTTLLTAVRTAAETCMTDANAPIPVFALIRNWPRKTSLKEWALSPIRTVYPNLDFSQRGVFYFFDGLDELGGERPEYPNTPNSPRFDPRVEFIQALQSELSDCDIVVTCRVEDYEDMGKKLSLTGAVTLLPLDNNQIATFLRDRQQSELWTVLQQKENKELLDMVRTPLLLTLLSAAVWEQSTTFSPDSLPMPTAFGIFDFYIKQRFDHEEQKVHQAHLPPLPFDEETTRKQLGRLAASMWETWQNPAVSLTQEKIEQELGTEGRALTDFACKMHFLQKSSTGEISFVHLQLRDYCVVLGLEDALRDAARRVNWFIVNALEMMGEPAVPALVNALRNEDWNVRLHVSCALGRINAAVPMLLDALRDNEESMRSVVRAENETPS